MRVVKLRISLSVGSQASSEESKNCASTARKSSLWTSSGRMMDLSILAAQTVERASVVRRFQSGDRRRSFTRLRKLRWVAAEVVVKEFIILNVVTRRWLGIARDVRIDDLRSFLASERL